jgi:hypothetical protein
MEKGNVNFNCINAYSNSLEYLEKADVEEFGIISLINKVIEDINHGIPVILKISNPAHFVLAIGRCGNKFVISDPSGIVELYDPYGARALLGIRRFKYVE